MYTVHVHVCMKIFNFCGSCIYGPNWCDTSIISYLHTMNSGFNIDAATTAFREVFPSTDGSLLRSIPDNTTRQLLMVTITNTFNIKNETDIRTASDDTIQRILMHAALGLLANNDSGGEPWATVMYNPATEKIASVPSSTTTRQLFADVIVVLAVIALSRVWIFTRVVHEKPTPN